MHEVHINEYASVVNILIKVVLIPETLRYIANVELTGKLHLKLNNGFTAAGVEKSPNILTRQRKPKVGDGDLRAIPSIRGEELTCDEAFAPAPLRETDPRVLSVKSPFSDQVII